MLIGIDFADNDFNVTVRAFLGIFYNTMLTAFHPEEITKENIVKIWNECFWGIYLGAQAGIREKRSKDDDEYLRAGLMLKEKYVYLDQECLDRIIKDNNCEFNYIDTDSGEIYCS